MAGLLDGLLGTRIEDPETKATMAMVQGLWGGRGLLQGASSGVMNYGNVMQQAKQQAAAEEMRKMQLAQHAFQFQQAKKAQEQADLDKLLTQQAFTRVKPIEANAASGIAGPRQEALGAVGALPQFSPDSFISQGGSAPLAFQLQQSLAKERPKVKEFKEVRNPDGSVQIVGFDEYGQPVKTGQTPFKAAERVDLGGRIGLVDPFTNKEVGGLGKTMTPGEIATNSLGRDRLTFDRSQADKPQFDSERGILVNPRAGTALPVTMGGAPIGGKQKDLTEAQGNAVAFYMRAQNALDNLAKVDSISNGDYWNSKLPWGTGNFIMSENGQKAINAERQFIAGVLRKESGAAISAGEYQTYGDQFFPRPGDTKETLQTKAQNRQVALEGMKVQSGQHGASEAAAALGRAQGGQTRVPLPMNDGFDQSDPFGIRPLMGGKMGGKGG